MPKFEHYPLSLFHKGILAFIIQKGLMNDEKTVHYPLFTQNDLPSPEQETTFPPAHRTLSDKLLST